VRIAIAAVMIPMNSALLAACIWFGFHRLSFNGTATQALDLAAFAAAVVPVANLLGICLARVPGVAAGVIALDCVLTGAFVARTSAGGLIPLLVTFPFLANVAALLALRRRSAPSEDDRKDADGKEP
jgi:hypothetical protein